MRVNVDAESFALNFALTEYRKGWNAHAAGLKLGRYWSSSKKDGWKLRKAHGFKTIF